MQPQTAVVIGATGLIGSNILQLLLNDDAFKEIRILVRKPTDQTHPKLTQLLVDFADENDFSTKLGKGDCLFCAVGTTQQKVKGDLNAYRKVDYDIPINAARLALKNGFTSYLLVSSVGAKATAKNFYLKLKGEVENAVSSLPFKSVHIFQPSMLLGERKEFRLGEVIGKPIISLVSFLLVGRFQKYRAIKASHVAQSMVNAAKKDLSGVYKYEYKQIKDLAINRV